MLDNYPGKHATNQTEVFSFFTSLGTARYREELF